jgi:hypothetical protein
VAEDPPDGSPARLDSPAPTPGCPAKSLPSADPTPWGVYPADWAASAPARWAPCFCTNGWVLNIGACIGDGTGWALKRRRAPVPQSPEGSLFTPLVRGWPRNAGAEGCRRPPAPLPAAGRLGRWPSHPRRLLACARPAPAPRALKRRRAPVPQSPEGSPNAPPGPPLGRHQEVPIGRCKRLAGTIVWFWPTLTRRCSGTLRRQCKPGSPPRGLVAQAHRVDHPACTVPRFP